MNWQHIAGDVLQDDNATDGDIAQLASDLELVAVNFRLSLNAVELEKQDARREGWAQAHRRKSSDARGRA